MALNSKGSCRVCHRDAGKLVSPCACEGSMKFVHSKCLSDWVLQQRSLRCEVCGTNYSVAKVLSCRRNDETHEKFLRLLRICIQRYLRQSLEMFLWILFRILAILITPLTLSLFHYAVGPFISVSMPWHHVTQSLINVEDSNIFYSFIIGVELMIFSSPFFLLWQTWQEWRSAQDDLLAPELREDIIEEVGPNPNLTEYINDEEEEEIDRQQEKYKELIGEHALEAAILPKENATILEAILLAQKRSDGKPIVQYLLPSSLLLLSARFIIFYLTIWVVVKLIPEVMRSISVAFWIFIDGDNICKNIIEKILLTTSYSEGIAYMRYAMLLSFIDALKSSTLVLWSIVHFRKILSVWIFMNIVKRYYRFSYRKTIISAFIYLRGMLNFLMLSYYVLPTVCFLITVLCLDFFESNISIESDKFENAWKTLYFSDSKSIDRKYSLEFPNIVDGPSPVSVFQAIEVLSQENRDDICWNYRDLRFGNISGSSNNNNINILKEEKLIVYEDDSISFYIFILTTVVSKIDCLALITTGYVVMFIAAFIYHLLWIIATTVPVEWIRHSSLCKILKSNAFQMINILDIKTTIYIYSEIFIFTTVVSCIIIRYSLSLVHTIDPRIVPLMQMENTTNSSSICWMRVIFLLYTAPQELIDVVHNFITSMLINLFEIDELTERETFSLPNFISRIVRITAFVFCYWFSIVMMIAIYIIPGLYMISKKMGFLRGICFAHLNAYKGMRFFYPNLFTIVLNQIKIFILQIHSSFLYWRLNWWFTSCLGFWLNLKNRSGDNISRYELKRIEGIPEYVIREFDLMILLICNKLNECIKDSKSEESVKRIEKVLKSYSSYHHIHHHIHHHNHYYSNNNNNKNNNLLREEDLSIILNYLKPPGIQRSLSFIMIWILLLLIIPFIVGTVALSLMHSFIMTPYCYTGPKILDVIFPYLWGVILTTSILFSKTQEINILQRLQIYFFCGCHSFKISYAVNFILIPIFMRITGTIIVPYTLINTIMQYLPHSSNVPIGNFLFTIIAFLATVNSTKVHLVTVNVVERARTGLIAFRERRAPVILTPRRVQSENNSEIVENSEIEGNPQQDEINNGMLNWSNAIQKVNSIKYFSIKIIEKIKKNLHALREASILLLKEVAERENILNVVFVDRSTNSS